ncbi:MAG: hypothetical protein Q7R96_00945 [Nanoarchaeota archaeon]|nr:hypothetical protein [Nanoarchaeota archaeon]
MKNHIIPVILIFVVVLAVFSLLSTKVLFTDAPQYVNTAKEFAGFALSKVRNFSAWLYPLLLGESLKIVPSLVTLKLVNLLWLVLDVLVLYWFSRRASVVWLFVFSPLVWVTAPWINPILPVSFFLLFAYVALQKFEVTKKAVWFIVSGLSLGLVSALWWPGTYLVVLFLFSFFLQKRFSQLIVYLIPVAGAASIRLVIDWYYFSFPFFSAIRGLGSNFLYFTGQADIIPGIKPPALLIFALILVVVSPLVFRLYKVDRRVYGRELLFLALATLLFCMNLEIRYFITIVPLVLLLLSFVLEKKEIVLHAFIGVLLIIFLTHSYFGMTDDHLLQQDVVQLGKDFPDKIFIVGTDGVSEEQAMDLSTLYWGDDIKGFVTYRDYQLSMVDERVYKEYIFASSSRINELRNMRLSLTYERSDEDLDDLQDLLIIGDAPPPAGFKLVKQYAVLRYYQR